MLILLNGLLCGSSTNYNVTLGKIENDIFFFVAKKSLLERGDSFFTMLFDSAPSLQSAFRSPKAEMMGREWDLFDNRNTFEYMNAQQLVVWTTLLLFF